MRKRYNKEILNGIYTSVKLKVRVGGYEQKCWTSFGGVEVFLLVDLHFFDISIKFVIYVLLFVFIFRSMRTRTINFTLLNLVINSKLIS